MKAFYIGIIFIVKCVYIQWRNNMREVQWLSLYSQAEITEHVIVGSKTHSMWGCTSKILILCTNQKFNSKQHHGKIFLESKKFLFFCTKERIIFHRTSLNETFPRFEESIFCLQWGGGRCTVIYSKLLYNNIVMCS